MVFMAEFCLFRKAQSLHTGGVMTDGQTISTPSGGGSESNAQQRYRTDKIAWVHGTEANCTYIGKLIRLMDSVVNYCKGQLPPYSIKGRTQVTCLSVRGWLPQDHELPVNVLLHNSEATMWNINNATDRRLGTWAVHWLYLVMIVIDSWLMFPSRRGGGEPNNDNKETNTH